jgi:hypothetical protein
VTIDINNSLGEIGCGAHTVSMDDSRSLKVHVEKRGNKYVWSSPQGCGSTGEVFGAHLWVRAAARTSGDEVRKDHLARLAARSAKRS